MRHEHHGSSLVNASCAPCGDKLHRHHHKQHFMILLTLTLKLTLTHPKVPTPTEPTSHMAMLVCTSWPSCISRTSGANPCTTAIRHTDRVDGGRPCETQKTLDGQLASNESQHICQSRPGTPSCQSTPHDLHLQELFTPCASPTQCVLPCPFCAAYHDT